MLDEKRKEQIISGKGIGFGKKYGDEVDAEKIQKIYILRIKMKINMMYIIMNYYRKTLLYKIIIKLI